jgi:hypothetical protein
MHSSVLDERDKENETIQWAHAVRSRPKWGYLAAQPPVRFNSDLIDLDAGKSRATTHYSWRQTPGPVSFYCWATLQRIAHSSTSLPAPYESTSSMNQWTDTSNQGGIEKAMTIQTHRHADTCQGRHHRILQHKGDTEYRPGNVLSCPGLSCRQRETGQSGRQIGHAKALHTNAMRCAGVTLHEPRHCFSSPRHSTFSA